MPSAKKENSCLPASPMKWACICGRSPVPRCSAAKASLATAEKVCRTRRAFLTRLLSSDRALRMVLASARRAAAHKLRIDFVVDVQGVPCPRSARPSAGWTKAFAS